LVGYLELPDGKTVDVADGLVLGRTSSCAVVIKDNKASRRHAQLIVAGPVVEIEDLDSSNGTLLNDKPVKRRMLRDGDVVQIGTTRITYRERSLSETWAPAPPDQPDQPAAGEDLFAEDVLEFADDEVVQVPKTPPPPPPPRLDQPASGISMTKTVVMPKRTRPPTPLGGKPVLRIGDDLRQMSVSMRLLSVLAALAVAGALGYLAYRLVR
jgi:predicted component of type VI protein secretion system